MFIGIQPYLRTKTEHIIVYSLPNQIKRSYSLTVVISLTELKIYFLDMKDIWKHF